MAGRAAARACEAREAELAGETGEPDTRAFFILKGSVRLSRKDPSPDKPGEHRVATVHTLKARESCGLGAWSGVPERVFTATHVFYK